MKQRANLRSPLFLQYASRPAEAESENLMLYSEEFSGSNWGSVNTSLTANLIESPDGATSGNELQRTSTAASYRSHNISKSASEITYTTSVFVKKGNDNYFAMRAQGSYPSRVDVRFNLDTGEVYQTQSFSNFDILDYGRDYYGEGWYRVHFTYKTDTHTNLAITFSPRESDGTIDSSDTSDDAFAYVWGAQTEEGTQATSYIKTEGTTVTRAATTAAQEEDVTAELRIYNGGGGYDYERTNYCLNSTQLHLNSTLFSGATISLTGNYSTAPDGTLTATRIQASGTGSNYAYLSMNGTNPTNDDNGGGYYRSSVYVKSNTGSNQNILMFATGASGSSVREVTTEWTRIEALGYRPANAKFIYIGYGSGADTDLDFLVWGGQTELNDLPVTSFIPTEATTVTELAYQTEAPTEATYTLTRTPNNAKATFEVSELVRDYIEQTLENTSGTTWLEVTLSDSIQLPRHYHFLCTEGYIDNTEGLQTYLNAPSNETFMQSNSTVLIPEGESLQIPINAQYNSFYAFDRTNLVTDSENFDSSYYSVFNGASVSNGITSPSGCNNAYNLETNGSSFSFIKPASNITVTNGETYTFSIFVKANQISSGYLRLDYGSTIYNRKFDLSTESFSTGFDNTGNIPNNETIKKYFDNWYRVSITDVVDATSFEARLYVSGSSGATSGDSLYIYGAQLENNSKATSYVKGVQNDNAVNYFSNLDDNTTQIEYITVNSGDESIKLYVDSVVTEEITIKEIDSSKYANNKLLFVNKYGAKQEFYVNMKSTEKIRVKDDGFSRNVIDYANLSVTNGLHSYKRRVLESKEMHTLNTPFLDEENVQAFEELLLSEYVWYKKEGGDYIPVIIKDSNMTRKTHLNDKLIQYTIEVESANNLINIQR